MIVQTGTPATPTMGSVAGQEAGYPGDVERWLRTATPKTLAEWLSRLPKSNVAAAAQQQLQLLKRLDETELPPMQKFALLDVVRTGAYQTVEALTCGFMGSGTGFSDHFKAIINQAMLLQGQLVTCYTNVAISARLLGEQQLFIMGSALHRAMMDEYSMLGFYLQLHLPVPQQLWRQLNRLYKVAEDAHLLAHVMGDNVFASEQMLTIKQIYIAAALLGSARTGQLHAEDVMTTAKCLKKWALQAEISHQSESAQAWQLVVDIAGANAPHFESLATIAAGGQWRYLHTRKLAAYLPKQAGTVIRIGDRNAIPSSELVRHLVAAWTEYVERDNTRHSRDDSVTACIGLGNVHHYLCGGRELNEFMGDVHKHAPFGDDRQLVIGHVPEVFGFHTYMAVDASQVAQDRYPSHDVRVINESSTGYCLEWPLSLLSQLPVGAIVGVKEAYAPYWKLAEVVWSRKAGDGKLRTGLRTLANEAMPLAVRIPYATGERAEAIAGFLLAPDRELGTDKTMFLSANVKMKMGEHVHLIQEGNEQLVQLLEPVKETLHYSLFDCAFVVQP